MKGFASACRNVSIYRTFYFCQVPDIRPCKLRHFFIDNGHILCDHDSMIHIWRLSQAGPDNLGLACTDEGLVLGRTSLIERRDGRYVVREQREIARLLKRAYSEDLPVSRLMGGLATVASALNANDRCLAHIAAVHLRIPDLPNADVRQAIDVEDALVKLARPSTGQAAEVRKASPDDPLHPGWPAGTEGGRGGKFRPKDGSQPVISEEAAKKIRRLAMRRALRTGALRILRISAEALGSFIPGIGIAADIAAMVDLANTISEFIKLKIDTDAAIDFIKKGPYTLAELKVSSPNGYEEFPSYDAFYKDAIERGLVAKRFGPAGPGSQYHHIVTQGGANEDNIPPEKLHNTDDIVILPTLLHEAVNGEYLKPSPYDPNISIYEWLQTQPYEVQYEEGLKILRRLHLLKESD